MTTNTLAHRTKSTIACLGVTHPSYASVTSTLSFSHFGLYENLLTSCSLPSLAFERVEVHKSCCFSLIPARYSKHIRGEGKERDTTAAFRVVLFESLPRVEQRPRVCVPT
ncbi:unnamed protein product, partial [Ectocarpus sp. 12 AP-2014]